MVYHTELSRQYDADIILYTAGRILRTYSCRELSLLAPISMDDMEKLRPEKTFAQSLVRGDECLSEADTGTSGITLDARNNK